MSIHDLARSLQASASTVRRDLEYLAENRYIERTYGGAHLARHPFGTTFEPEYEIGRHTHERAKRAIGRLAAGLVRPGCSVFFDSSSTVLEAARAVVAEGTEITAITNDLNIASQLAASPNVRTIVPGGTVRAHSFTLLGDPGAAFLERIHVDVALLGAHSLADGIMSDSSLEVVQVKRAMLAASTEALVLADASKFTAPRSFMEIGPLADVHGLVTDDGVTEDVTRLAADLDVALHVAVPEA